jgi:hypothetical protein
MLQDRDGIGDAERRDVRQKTLAVLLGDEGQKGAPDEILACFAEVPAVGIAREGQGPVGEPAGDEALIVGDRAMARID